MVTLRKQNQSRQAYTLVDINSIDDDELRKDIILDASEGGGIYGLRVVEEAVNGPIRAPIYGYYNGTEFEDRWNSAKDKLGLSGEEVDDAEVRGGPDVTDPRREAALREQAEESADVAAQRQRAAEDADVAQVTGGETKSNITDPTLDPAATNRADDPDAAAAAEAAAVKASKNKAPK
jgi:hypothetical protein